MTEETRTAAEVLISAMEGEQSEEWKSVWFAMREDAMDMDMPAAFMEALKAISGR